MSKEAGRCVLDASAVLAYLHKEPGHEQIARRLDDGVISAVNLSEVATKLAGKGLLSAQVVEVVQSLGLDVAPCGEELAYRAAFLRGATRAFGLSLADRICLATAQSLGLPAVTMDTAWAELKIGVRIEIARRTSPR